MPLETCYGTSENTTNNLRCFETRIEFFLRVWIADFTDCGRPTHAKSMVGSFVHSIDSTFSDRRD